MYKVICSLENAATNMSGIDFEEVDGVMVAVDVPEADALHFGKVPGFEIFSQEGLENLLDNSNDGMNYAELTVSKIKTILAQDPEAYVLVLSDEIAERGEDARDGVVNACEVAKQSLGDENGY